MKDDRPRGFGPAPMAHWAPHLTFEAASGGPGEGATFEGWSTDVLTIGQVRLRLLTDSRTRELVDDILGSARTFTTDMYGCDATSPVQAQEFVRPEPPFDVEQVDAVESISVCQYERHGGEGAALMASRRIDGEAAAKLLRGIKDAPRGGGPEWPQNCVKDQFGEHGLAVRLHHSGRTDDLYVYYDWCFGNGIDDGTNRRELTADNCAPLFGDGVVAWSYQSALDARCGD